MPHLLTLAEAAAQLAAAEFDRQRREWTRRWARPDSPFRGNPVPYFVNYREYLNFGWPDEGDNLACSRSSTPDLRDTRKCETCRRNPPEDWLGSTERALCLSEH